MLALGLILFCCAIAGWAAHHHPSTLAKGPQRPAAGLSPADVADGLVTVVALSWTLVGLAVCFAPIGLLCWWLAR